MANPCGVAHFPDYPCRECERIRAQTTSVEPRSSSPALDAAVEYVEDIVKRVVEAPKPVRAAKSAVRERGVIPEQSLPEDVAYQPLTSAQKQRRYRERHGDRVREMDRERKALMRRNPTKLIMPAFSTDEDIEAAKKLVEQAHDPPKSPEE